MMLIYVADIEVIMVFRPEGDKFSKKFPIFLNARVH